MKHLFKILSFSLALILCFSCFSITSVAAGNPAVTPVEITKLADLQNKIAEGYTGTTQHTVWSEDGHTVEFEVLIPEDCYVFVDAVATNLVRHERMDDLNVKGGLYSVGYSHTYIELDYKYSDLSAVSTKGYSFVNAGRYIISLTATEAEEDITVYVGMLPKTTVFTSVEYVSSNENSVTVKINSLDKVSDLYVYNDKYGQTNSVKTLGDHYTMDAETGYVTLPMGKDKNTPENTNQRFPRFSYQVTDVLGFTHVEHFEVFCNATVDVQGIVNKTYTGKALTQSDLNVKCCNGNAPSYKVTYKNNVNAGTATMVFEGTGEWIGSVTRTFKINPVKADKCNISLSNTSYTYNGKTQKPTVSVKYGSKTLIEGVDYTVSYPSSSKSVGKYAIIVKFKGNYTGSKTVYFTIVPKDTSLSSVSVGTKKLTPKWAKQTSQTSGYQIQYATKSSFSGAKTLTVSKNSATSSTITGLKAKTKYYVRVRTYKTVKFGGETIKLYSSWSKAKTAKTK